MDNLTQRLQFYWRIRWLKRSVITAASALAILLLIPLIIQFAMTHWLIKQGARDASIDDINFNPFAGSFEITRLHFQADSYPQAQLDKLDFNLAMLDLLSGHIVVSDLIIDGLQADITRERDSTLNINGLAIKPAAQSEQPQPETKSTAPDFGLEKLHISNSRIHYQESALQQQLDITSLKLANIKSWDKDSLAALEADLKLNAGAIQLATQMRLFDAIKRIDGTLSIKDLKASDFDKFYPPQLTRLTATLALDSNFEINIGDTLSAQVENTLTLSDLNAQYQKQQLKLARLNIEGKSRIHNIAPDQIARLMTHPQAPSSEQTLNLFSGSLELEKLKLEDSTAKHSAIEHIRVDIASLDGLAQRYEIADIDISGIHSAIRRDNDGVIQIDGVQLGQNTDQVAATDSSQKSMPLPQFAVKRMRIRQSDINYHEDDFDQNNHIDEIRLTQLKSWDKTSPARLDIKARLNDAPFQLQANLTLFDTPRKVSGNTSLQQLAIEQYQKFAQAYAQNLSGHLSLSSQFDIVLGEQVSGRIDHQIQLQKLDLNYRDIQQQAERIEWKGQAEIARNELVSVTGDLDISNSQTQDRLQKYRIAALDRLSIKGFQHDARQQQIKQLTLDNFSFIDNGKHKRFVALQKLAINKVRYQPADNKLSVEQVTLAKPAISATLNKDKQLAELDPLLKTLERITPHKPSSKDKSVAPTPLDINIARIQLKQNGSIRFEDRSVSPFYKTQIGLDQIDIRKLSRHDDGKFNIALKQGAYTKIELKGDGLLLDPAQKLDLKARISQLDLPPVTPYTSHFMGYGMKSGVVDSDIKVNLEKRNIDALINLKIDSIEVIETDKKTAEQVTSASGMSLDLAISSLKDKNNVIDLELPIKGNIDEPDFDLSLIFNKAMGKAMKATTLAYLKNSLQPFGSLITLYSLAKAAADHISLPPLLFEVNSTEYQPKQTALLEKVIKVLNERPGLKIKACGVSTLADENAIRTEMIEERFASLEKARLADKKSATKPVDKKSIEVSDDLIQQKMLELADRRAARVKADFLKAGKLKPERILNCLSSVKKDDKSKPQVEILI